MSKPTATTRQHPAFAGMRVPRTTRFNVGTDPLATARENRSETHATNNARTIEALDGLDYYVVVRPATTV